MLGLGIYFNQISKGISLLHIYVRYNVAQMLSG